MSQPVQELAGEALGSERLGPFGECCLRIDISDLLLVEDQLTTNHSFRQCPVSGEQHKVCDTLSVGMDNLSKLNEADFSSD